MTPRSIARCLLAALLAWVAPTLGHAQSCSETVGPTGASFDPSQSVNYDQYWCVPAKAPTGWTFAYCNGDDIFARRFDANLNPLGNQFLVNTTYSVGTQDEPAISYNNTNGNFLIAWSERNGYDGGGMGMTMGIMGRVFDVQGNPLGTEFVINQITVASQWRPLISQTRTGGWIVAWSGDSDGNSYFRILDSNGAFLTGDILVNTYPYDAQVDPSAAESPSGTIFVAFVDYSSHGNVGTGINLYGRTFDARGNPLQPSEFLLTTPGSMSDGDQRNPRVAADGLGRFFVVWTSELGDGSGFGIYERVFSSNGTPLLPEFLVNTTTAGDQITPIIVVDSMGRALVTWQDDKTSPGDSRIRGRLFDGQVNPLGPDFLISDDAYVGAGLPFPAMDSTANEFVVGWQGPGPAPLNGVDLFARRFQVSLGPQTYCVSKVNSLGCAPSIGYSGSPSASSTSPFLVTGSNVLNQRLALLLYGYNSAFGPYQGSILCVQQPLNHGPAVNSGGSATGTSCTGAPSMDFNALIRSGVDPRLVPGTTVSARWYYRDPQDPTGFGSGMTDALRFAICP